MVIYFKSARALEFLHRHGFVLTLRARRRSGGRHGVKIRRDLPATLEVTVTEWGRLRLPEDRDKLEDYVLLSGFDSVDEWLEEVRRLNRGRLPREVWLYLVELPRAPEFRVGRGGPHPAPRPRPAILTPRVGGGGGGLKAEPEEAPRRDKGPRPRALWAWGEGLPVREHPEGGPRRSAT